MANTDGILSDLDSEKPGKEDKAISEKSNDNERWEEEFYNVALVFLLPIVIGIDIVYLPDATNLGTPLVIGILQILFFVVFFPPVMRVFQRITVAFGRDEKEKQ